MIFEFKKLIESKFDNKIKVTINNNNSNSNNIIKQTQQNLDEKKLIHFSL